jgi:SAM-dependent methyltransferase
MRRIEKVFLNRLQSKKRAVDLAQKLLGFAELHGKQDFLEAGCGNGVVAKYIAARYQSDVVGIDIDPEQIGLAQKSTGDVANIRFLEADVTSLPFTDNSFDVVLSFGVMHYIPNWLDAFREIKRVLRGGGYFIYADIIYPELVTKWDRSSKLSFGLVTVSIDDLNSFIRHNGFATLHSLLAKFFVCRNYEAVYQKS